MHEEFWSPEDFITGEECAECWERRAVLLDITTDPRGAAWYPEPEDYPSGPCPFLGPPDDTPGRSPM
jgi:hypothetical protein